MFKEILDRLLTFPQRGQVTIDFDLTKKIFRLSAPVFASKGPFPQSIEDYVKARQDRTFKPHTTSFQKKEQKILLVQEIPFALSFQATLRNQVDHFWQMAKQCHRMFSEMALEEKYKDALYLDSHFEE